MNRYKKAGVDIAAGNKFINNIKGLLDKTDRSEVLEGIGGFAGLFELKKYRNPVLVSSTDGVGTKILLANQWKRWDGIGQDCVAMCVNDIGCYGAEPLFFLDYLASSKLDGFLFQKVVGSMAKACQEVGCTLLGGETAEMPGIYPPGEFDIAGFAVGVVEKEELIDGKKIEPGDRIVGIASSGFHSNGFSLIRKIIGETQLNLEMGCAETELSLVETLLLPTKLYTPFISALKKKVSLKGIAHITGGGLIENPPRILPKGCAIQLKEGSWPIPQYMEMFREKGRLSREEFYQVWNAGIGLVVVISPQEREKLMRALHDLGQQAWLIGEVISGKEPQVFWQ